LRGLARYFPSSPGFVLGGSPSGTAMGARFKAMSIPPLNELRQTCAPGALRAEPQPGHFTDRPRLLQPRLLLNPTAIYNSNE
jgi:hypothetical protein